MTQRRATARVPTWGGSIARSSSTKRVAESYIRQLDAAKVFDKPVLTEVVPLERFYKGEEYHQDYAARNPLQPYILFTARPKVDKVRKYYKDRLKGGR